MSWGLLGISWGSPGVFSGHPGVSWGSLGGLLGVSCASPGALVRTPGAPQRPPSGSAGALLRVLTPLFILVSNKFCWSRGVQQRHEPPRFPLGLAAHVIHVAALWRVLYLIAYAHSAGPCCCPIVLAIGRWRAGFVGGQVRGAMCVMMRSLGATTVTTQQQQQQQ